MWLRRIEVILMTIVRDEAEVAGRIRRHPISLDRGWIYPNKFEKPTILHAGVVYSLLLE